MNKLIGAMVLALLPGMAAAEGFYSRDVGEGGSPEACLSRARQAVETYARRNGTPNAIVVQGAWSLSGYDLYPGQVDVQVACPYRDNIASIVVVTGHSDGNEADRITVIEGIGAIWDQLGQGGAPAATK